MDTDSEPDDDKSESSQIDSDNDNQDSDKDNNEVNEEEIEDETEKEDLESTTDEQLDEKFDDIEYPEEEDDNEDYDTTESTSRKIRLQNDLFSLNIEKSNFNVDLIKQPDEEIEFNPDKHYKSLSDDEFINILTLFFIDPINEGIILFNKSNINDYIEKVFAEDIYKIIIRRPIPPNKIILAPLCKLTIDIDRIKKEINKRKIFRYE